MSGALVARRACAWTSFQTGWGAKGGGALLPGCMLSLNPAPASRAWPLIHSRRRPVTSPLPPRPLCSSAPPLAPHPQETFAAMMRDAGFQAVTYENLTQGVVALHSGFKL
jgi:hypothetical protein